MPKQCIAWLFILLLVLRSLDDWKLNLHFTKTMQSSCMTLTRQLDEVTSQNCEIIIGKNVCCCQSCNIHLECKLCPLSYLPTTPCLQSIHVTAFEKKYVFKWDNCSMDYDFAVIQNTIMYTAKLCDEYII